ncbi:MAG: hypothetical protein ACRCV0_05795 [Brevinema sp.]
MTKWMYMVLLIPAIIFGNTIPTEPKEIVTYAINSLMKGQAEELLLITEKSELRKTKELIDNINNKTYSKDSLLEQYSEIESWNIEKSQEHKINGRVITIVSTVWKIKPPKKMEPNQISNTESIGNNIQTVYVDYMLEKFNGQWKIISRKTVR